MNVAEIDPLTLPSLPLRERKNYPVALQFTLHKDGQPITEVSYDC